MPRITDDDDVNLDDIDTTPPQQAQGPDEVDDTDLPDADEQPDFEDREPEPSKDQDDEDEQDKRLAPTQEPTRDRRPRENDRIRSLNDDLRRSQEQTEALQRRFDDFVSRSQQNQQRESEEQRNQRRAVMTPEERMSEDLRDSEWRTQRALQQQSFSMQDSTDKSLYDTRSNSIEGYRRYRDRVEAERSRLVQGGANVGRRAVLCYLVGDKVV